MNPSPQHHDSVAGEQASLWAARLDGDTLDRTQRIELDAWLAQNPAHRRLLTQYCQFSADLEDQVPALVAAGAVSIPESARPRTRRMWKWNFPRVGAIALAAAAAAAVTVSIVRPAPHIQNVAMAPAERGARTLADGTRVELNANTSLRFENTRTLRRVQFAGGEALFAVTRDPSRPFVVETPAGSVRVTGTTFNVRSDPSRNTFEVTVVEGSVNVRPGETEGTSSSAPIPLTAADQYSSRTRGVRSLSKIELDDALAWRNGTVVFYDVPLKEAAARFAHYHGCAINVAPAIANVRIGGRHNLDKLNEFLAGVELALPRVEHHRDPSGAIVLSARPGS
ncbi:MAG: FecR family protein [Opitutaceae bacterium]